MLPCCGFFYIPNEELDNVVISGCPNGIDWSVIHDGDKVILELDDGTKESVAIEDYRKAVYDFVDKVEAFYNSCSPKVSQRMILTVMAILLFGMSGREEDMKVQFALRKM